MYLLVEKVIYLFIYSYCTRQWGEGWGSLNIVWYNAAQKSLGIFSYWEINQGGNKIGPAGDVWTGGYF